MPALIGQRQIQVELFDAMDMLAVYFTVKDAKFFNMSNVKIGSLMPIWLVIG